MFILLSPAKKLAENKVPRTKDFSEPALLEDIETLTNILKKKSVEDIKDLMGLSETLAVLNYERYKKFAIPFTAQNAQPALFTFDGDVYANMQVEDYSEDMLDYAQAHVRILSGLYGVLRPLDLMHPYRLEMGTKLEGPWGKDLYSFWGDKITNQIKLETAGRTLVNLASQEYAKAVDFKAFDRVIYIDFKHAKEGGLKTIGILAKRARGMMANYVINHELEDVELLKHFTEDDYKFSHDLSDDENWVFVKVID
jgi:hypothetical protein